MSAVFKALYTFDQRDRSDLELRPGDLIDVPIIDAGEWGMGISRRTGAKGAFPWTYVHDVTAAPLMPPGAPPLTAQELKALEDQEWFAGPMSREAAMKALNGHPDGTFLIRTSTRHDGYSLSVFYLDICRHVQVLKDGAGKYDFTLPCEHASIAAFVEHFQAVSLSVFNAEFGTKLVHPYKTAPLANRPAWDQRSAPRERWLECLAGRPSGTFVVRASDNPGPTTIGTITIVTPGGDGAHFNQQIAASTMPMSIFLVGSKHEHKSVGELIKFYQDPMYFAQAGKLDVPVQLIGTPASDGAASSQGAIYEHTWWQKAGGGGGGSASGGVAPNSPPTEDIYGTIYDSDHGGTPTQKKLYERIVVGGQESIYDVLTSYNPLEELPRTPVVTLAEAVAILAPHCSGDLEECCCKAEAYAATHAHVGTVQHPGAEPVTITDIAVVHLYTMETDFYGRMNQELEGYGQGATHEAVQYFLPITKLLVTALAKLPPLSVKLFRGVKLPHKAILKQFDGASGEEVKVKDVVMWKQFTSCSTSPDVLKDANFLGEGTAGTVFQIIAVTGVNIKDYSAISTEDEVLLPPGSKFVVEKFTSWKHGVTEVRLRQIVPPGPEMNPQSSPIYEEISHYMKPGGGGGGGGGGEAPRWFVGSMVRYECDRIVSQAGAGCFLVRQSSQANKLVLSVNHQGKVKSFQIHFKGEVGANSKTTTIYEICGRKRASLDLLIDDTIKGGLHKLGERILLTESAN